MIDKHLIRILNDISEFLQLKGENPFKARAYETAADLIEAQELDVHELYKQGKLAEVKGFGEALQSKIADYVKNGKMTYYENLREEVPEGLVRISKIKGLGPGKARKLYFDEEVTTIEKLLEKCESGELAKIKGFGEKSVEQIIKGIYKLKDSQGKFLLDVGFAQAEELFNKLKEIPVIEKIALCGNLNRGIEINTEIEFLSVLKENTTRQNLIEQLADFLVKDNGDSIEFLTDEDYRVVIHFTLLSSFYWELHKHNSGSDYQEAFESLLKMQGYDFEEINLKKAGTIIEITSEAELYSKTGLSYVPIEIRDEAQAVQFANQGSIPDLIEEHHMKGMLHCHSTWSDGRNTLREMALGAKELGFTYFAICDHSRTAAYANGLSIDRLKEQHKEIDALNQEDLDIKILKGIESDILSDGSLDYPEEILKLFDIVVASVHSGFNLSEKDMTNRISNALRNPYTTILGHATGKLLLRRDGYSLDLKEIIKVAKEENKVIEINANPNRLDVDAHHALYAKQLGVKLAINPDAHSVKGLKDFRWGIKIARRAWLEPQNVINTMSYHDFVKEFVKK